MGKQSSDAMPLNTSGAFRISRRGKGHSPLIYAQNCMEMKIYGLMAHEEQCALHQITEISQRGPAYRHICLSGQHHHILSYHFHQRRRIRIRIPNPIITLYYAQLFPLVQIWIQIPVRIVSWMVAVPILGRDLCPRDPNPNPSPLVEMSHGEGGAP